MQNNVFSCSQEVKQVQIKTLVSQHIFLKVALLYPCSMTSAYFFQLLQWSVRLRSRLVESVIIVLIDKRDFFLD